MLKWDEVALEIGTVKKVRRKRMSNAYSQSVDDVDLQRSQFLPSCLLSMRLTTRRKKKSKKMPMRIENHVRWLEMVKQKQKPKKEMPTPRQMTKEKQKLMVEEKTKKGIAVKVMLAEEKPMVSALKTEKKGTRSAI